MNQVCGVLCRKRNKRITQVHSFTFNSLEEALRFIRKRDVRKIVLTLSGKGVLTRSFKGEAPSPASVLNDMTGTPNVEDFFTQQRQIDAHTFISLIRASQCQSIIEEVEKTNGLEVISIQLDTYGLLFFRDALHTDEAIFTCSEFSLELAPPFTKFQQGSKVKNDSILFDTFEIHRSALVALTSILNHVLQPSSNAYWAPFDNAITTKQQTRKLNKVTAAAILSILVVLIIDSVVFSRLMDDFNRTQERLEEHQMELSMIQSLQSSVSEKENMIEMFGSRKSDLSGIADRIAASIPEGISLHIMDVYPVSGKIKNGMPLSIDRGTIGIEGRCNGKSRFNQWIASLERSDDINSITILRYSEHSNEGEFSLKILLE